MTPVACDRGSVVEQPQTLAKAAALPNVDTIINGHIPVHSDD